jgi:2,4-didehydro-3-deoxy-L-rhamnonate hydrolase
MKLCRYDDNRLGVVTGEDVRDVTAVLDQLPKIGWPAPFGDRLIEALPRLRGEIERLARDARPVPAKGLRFRSPVANPSKIIGTPANFAAHVAEARADAEISAYLGGKQRSIEEQGLFLKAASSIVGPADGVVLHFPDRRTDHEAELGVVIGRKIAGVSEAEALKAVAGYAIALDMVVRGKEDRSFRKSPDTYAVLGPWLVTPDEMPDPGNLALTLDVNGERRQTANTRDMIIGVARQIAWASSVYTLYPGDVIMSGTPSGVGPVANGDVMTVTIEGIGAMDVSVRSAG